MQDVLGMAWSACLEVIQKHLACTPGPRKARASKFIAGCAPNESAAMPIARRYDRRGMLCKAKSMQRTCCLQVHTAMSEGLV